MGFCTLTTSHVYNLVVVQLPLGNRSSAAKRLRWRLSWTQLWVIRSLRLGCDRRGVFGDEFGVRTCDVVVHPHTFGVLNACTHSPTVICHLDEDGQEEKKHVTDN